MCEWNPVSSTCGRSCNQTFTQAACLSNSLCTWDAALNLCNTDCRKLTSAAQCASAADRCLSEVIPAMTPTFQCVAKPPVRFPTRPECQTNPMNDTMWDPVASVCKQACWLLSDAQCVSESFMCVLQGANKCRPACQFAYAAQPECDADSAWCRWDTARSKCQGACTTYTAQAVCNNNPTCQWAEAQCSPRCALQYATAATCNADKYCTWSVATGSCTNDCAKPVTATTPSTLAGDQCAAAPFCQVSNATATTAAQYCTADCPLFGQAQCLNDKRCQWDPQASTCKIACWRQGSRVNCQSEPGVCVFSEASGKCDVICRYRHLGTRTSCAADSADCQWDPTTASCKPACQRVYTQTSCVSNAECDWYAGSRVTKCMLYTNNQCEVDGKGRCSLFTAGYLGDNSYTGKKCVRACVVDYSTTPSCNADRNCVWDDTVELCATSCGRLAYEAGPALAGVVCNQSALCEFSSALGCALKCGIAYSDQVSCDSNDACQWDTLRSKCGRRCSVANNQGDCTSSGMCVWTASTSTCDTQCAYKYTNKAACNAAAACVYSEAAAQCMCKCGSTTQATCLDDSTCEYRSNTSTCTTGCESACLTEKCCTTQPGCMFNRVDGQCRKTCEQLAPAQCQSEAVMCVFNVYDSTCQRKCQTLFTAQAPCDGNALCMWDAAVPSCKQTCSFYASTGACTAQAMCKWDPKTNLCSKQCSNLATQPTCVADGECDWSAARNGTRKCAVKCVGRYETADECRLDAECMWDSANTRCTDSCTRLTLAQCAVNGMCRQDNGQCVQKCSTRYAAKSTCDADPNCNWDASLQLCAQLCTIIGSNTVECQQSSLCMWTGFTCVATCAWANASTGQCPTSRCQLNPLTRDCSAACSTLTGTTTCNNNPSCEWIALTGTCNGQCKTLTRQDKCMATASCMWDNSAGECRPACSRAASEGNCKADPLCTFNGGRCTMLCKFAHSDESSCNADNACAWTGSACTARCQTSARAADCNARTDCLYDSNSQRCKPVCSQIGTSAQCAAATNCGWNTATQSCGSKCGTAYSTAGACNADTTCIWDTAKQQCVDSCTSFGSNTVACLNQPMCASANGVCIPQCQFGYTAQSACANAPNGTCQWSTQRSMCYPACDKQTNIDSCSNDPMCRWNRAAATCQQSCTNAFSTEAPCAADPGCEWRAAAGTCVQKCMNRAADDCRSDPSCRLVGTRCETVCIQKYSDAAGCTGTAGECMWDIATQTCKTPCEQLSEAQCGQQPVQCAYNTTSQECKQTCLQKYSTNQAACNADPVCTYDDSRGVCTTGCTQQADRTGCLNIAVCKWDGSVSQCSRKCALKTSAAACTADRECQLTATSACREKCAFAYTAQASCDADSMCMWNAQTRTCQETCTSIASPQACAANFMCRYGTTACEKRCRYVSMANCSADVNCDWQGSSCAELCSSLGGDQATCTAQPNCMFVFGNCTSRCSRYSDAVSCNAKSGWGCTWNAGTLPSGACLTDCTSLSATQCGNQSLCKPAPGPTCTAACQLKYTDAFDCNRDANGECAWDIITGQCRVNCSKTTNKAMCGESSTCQWSDARERCEAQCQFVGDCKSRVDCQASATGGCAIACTTRGTVDSCTSDVNCQWNGGKCTQQCAIIASAGDCTLNANCIWDREAQGCVKQCALQYSTAATCQADARCMWDATATVCKTTCAKVYIDSGDALNVSRCNNLGMCRVDGANKCVLQCAFLAQTTQACAGIASCQYNPTTQQCTEACSAMASNAVDCNANPMCQATGSGSGCVSRCQTRHT
ncbi:MAG: hypothetical protein ACK53C_06805, partial [Pseudomonadota bacterium]